MYKKREEEWIRKEKKRKVCELLMMEKRFTGNLEREIVNKIFNDCDEKKIT